MSVNSIFKIEYICLQFFLHPVEVTFSHVLLFSFDVMLDVDVLAQPCLNYFKRQAMFWVLAKSWPWSAAGCSTNWKYGKLWNNIAELKERGCSIWKQMFPFGGPIFHMRNWSPLNKITPHTPLTSWHLTKSQKENCKKSKKTNTSHVTKGQRIRKQIVSH